MAVILIIVLIVVLSKKSENPPGPPSPPTPVPPYYTYNPYKKIVKHDNDIDSLSGVIQAADEYNVELHSMALQNLMVSVPQDVTTHNFTTAPRGIPTGANN